MVTLILVGVGFYQSLIPGVVVSVRVPLSTVFNPILVVVIDVFTAMLQATFAYVEAYLKETLLGDYYPILIEPTLMYRLV